MRYINVKKTQIKDKDEWRERKRERERKKERERERERERKSEKGVYGSRMIPLYHERDIEIKIRTFP